MRMDFYGSILEQVLLASGIQTQELLEKLMRERCCRALEEIRTTPASCSSDKCR